MSIGISGDQCCQLRSVVSIEISGVIVVTEYACSGMLTWLAMVREGQSALGFAEVPHLHQPIS